MDELKDVLTEALPKARIAFEGERLHVEMTPEVGDTFKVCQDWEEPSGSGNPIVFIELPDPRKLAEYREKGLSYVTVQGSVFLSTPHIHVDVRSARPTRMPDRSRNPFSDRGRAVCLVLLMQPGREWSYRELAEASSVSESFISRVVRALRDLGCVEGNVPRFVANTELLFAHLSEHWPKPSAFFAGRVPTTADASIGGSPAYERLGLALPGKPRVYVRGLQLLGELRTGLGAVPTTWREADWEAVIQTMPLPNDLVPAEVVALELAQDARGRETLRDNKIVPWPIHG